MSCQSVKHTRYIQHGKLLSYKSHINVWFFLLDAIPNELVLYRWSGSRKEAFSREKSLERRSNRRVMSDSQLVGACFMLTMACSRKLPALPGHYNNANSK
ncbi:hypothetical protein SDJN03_04815, partial [Cucurbita argyrosperma subsp. sororia]